MLIKSGLKKLESPAPSRRFSSSKERLLCISRSFPPLTIGWVKTVVHEQN